MAGLDWSPSKHIHEWQAHSKHFAMQGRMFLGLPHNAPQLLWTCSVLVLGNANVDLAQSWPSELVCLVVTFAKFSCFCRTSTRSNGARATKNSINMIVQASCYVEMDGQAQALPGLS